MAVKNPWVEYVTRSYQQIKDSLVNRLVTSNPEITDFSESNILIIIISMFAGVMEMLGYYVDNMAREAFIATARKFTSMVKLVKLLDYRIKAAYPATVDLLFTFNNPLSSAGTIPIGTIIKTANNIPFVLVDNLNIPAGATSGVIGAKQVTTFLNQTIGTTTGVANEPFSLGTSYVDKSSSIKVDGVVYNEVNTLGLSGPTDKVYIVEIDVDGLAYVVFGNNTNGAIPPTGKIVKANYDTTTASLGNVDANTINTIIGSLTLPGVTTITVRNPLPASGGSTYEDIERIRVNAPLSLRTLDRAVSRQDFRDVPRLAPGVGKSDFYFQCGKNIDVYICPEGGGIAQSPLLISTQAFVDNRKMITTFPVIQAAGETYLIIKLSVTAKFRADLNQTKSDVQNALIAYGSFANQNINKKVRISDIIALVDNLEKVEFVDLVGLGTKPYARPFEHTNQLLWDRETLPSSNSKQEWKLEFIGGVLFNVTKGGAPMGSVTINVPYTDPSNTLKFTIQASSYVLGQVWTFIVYPYNTNIELDDYTIPKVNGADLDITIIPQLTPPIQ